MKKRLPLFVLFALLIFLAACANSAPPPPSSAQAEATDLPPLPTLDPDQIALGETVYAQNCASCHGANLEGEADWKTQNEDDSFRAPPHTVDGHTWHHPDSLLLEAIELGGARYDGVNVGGTSNMPAFNESLTNEEITAVLTYIKSTWPEETRSVQWQVTVQTNNQ